MSRLALPPRNKIARVSLGLGVQPTGEASQRSAAARPCAPASAANVRRSPACDSDGWGSGDDSDVDSEPRSAQRTEQARQATSSRQGLGPPAPTTRPAACAPPSGSPPSVAPFCTPLSEVYDVGDSSDDDCSLASATAPGLGAASTAAPASGTALKPIQLGSAATPHPQDGKPWNQPRQAAVQGSQHVAGREQQQLTPLARGIQRHNGCMPAVGRCHQQQQQQQQLARVGPAAPTRLPWLLQEASPSPPQQAEPRQQQHCPVCKASISGMQLERQVAHVKACMAGRGARPAQQPQPQQPVPPRKTAQQPPCQPAARPSGAAWPAQSAASPMAQQRGTLQDIGQWLLGLGLGQYAATFQAEELDLHVMHAVTDAELASIGVADPAHRGRIMQAAQEAAALLGLGRARHVVVQPAARRQAAAMKQQNLAEVVAHAAAHGGSAVDGGSGDGRRAGAGAAPPASAEAASCQAWDRLEQQRLEQQRGLRGGDGQRDEGSRPQERLLLASLYPSRQQAQRGTAEGMPPQPQQQQRTPELPVGRSASRAAAQPLLWQGAASCVAAGPSLSDRLARREAQQTQGGAARQPLARGGTAYPAAEESRALKRLKLEALRQELRHHEATAAELRRMIEGLEREVAGGG